MMQGIFLDVQDNQQHADRGEACRPSASLEVTAVDDGQGGLPEDIPRSIAALMNVAECFGWLKGSQPNVSAGSFFGTCSFILNLFVMCILLGQAAYYYDKHRLVCAFQVVAALEFLHWVMLQMGALGLFSEDLRSFLLKRQRSFSGTRCQSVCGGQPL